MFFSKLAAKKRMGNGSQEFINRIFKHPPVSLLCLSSKKTILLIFPYDIFRRASFPIVPTTIPSFSASYVTDSSGALSN